MAAGHLAHKRCMADEPDEMMARRAFSMAEERGDPPLGGRPRAWRAKQQFWAGWVASAGDEFEDLLSTGHEIEKPLPLLRPASGRWRDGPARRCPRTVPVWHLGSYGFVDIISSATLGHIQANTYLRDKQIVSDANHVFLRPRRRVTCRPETLGVTADVLCYPYAETESDCRTEDTIDKLGPALGKSLHHRCEITGWLVPIVDEGCEGGDDHPG